MLERVQEGRGRLAEFLQESGIDPVYAATFLLLGLTLLQWKNVRRWNELEESEQFLLKALFFATAVAIIGCMLHIAGLF